MAAHEELKVFLGDWHALGTSYGGHEQSLANPHAGASPWNSIHSARWYSGNYFIVNHGFARDYALTVDGRTWTLTGEHERATYRFSEDGRSQEITWEWKPTDVWLPLCDRTANRIN